MSNGRVELIIRETFFTKDGQLFRKDRKSWKSKGTTPIGSANEKRYLTVSVSIDGKGKRFLVHRIIWFLEKGFWASEIDHIDRDKRNNRIDNMREVTRSQNLRNVGKKGADKSLPVGISLQRGYYHGSIRVNGKHHQKVSVSLETVAHWLAEKQREAA